MSKTSRTKAQARSDQIVWCVRSVSLAYDRGFIDLTHLYRFCLHRNYIFGSDQCERPRSRHGSRAGTLALHNSDATGFDITNCDDCVQDFLSDFT